MKITRVIDIVPLDHEYINAAIKISKAIDKEAEVIEHLTLLCTATLTIYFMILKFKGQHKDSFMYMSVTNYGVAISKPTDYEDAKYRFDNAIIDTKKSIEDVKNQ